MVSDHHLRLLGLLVFGEVIDCTKHQESCRRVDFFKEKEVDKNEGKDRGTGKNSNNLLTAHNTDVPKDRKGVPCPKKIQNKVFEKASHYYYSLL